jgi:DNA repair protein RadC
MNEYRKLNIKDWAVEDRPREKFLANGPRSLSDAELIAILIASGNLEETAVELSRRILNSVNNDINELGRKTIGHLSQFKGIGEAKAITIMAALELGRRRKETIIPDKVKVSCSRDAAELMMPLIGDLDNEEFWILLLDRNNKVKHKFMTSKGGITATIIDVRMIMKVALEMVAVSIILCHNHPSGSLKPSDADLQITQKIKDAGTIMDIKVLDHLIISRNDYYSFADNGAL